LSTKTPAFLSYAREDSAFALRLAADLRAAGANVWLDQLDIRPGRQWDREVEQALARCSEMLVILSPAGVDSSNVMDEVAFALEERKTVIPVLQCDCRIPFRLRRLQHVDFRSAYEVGLQALLSSLAVDDQRAPAASSGGGATESALTKSAEMVDQGTKSELGRIEQNRIERERAEATQKAEQDRIEQERAEATQKAEQNRTERERAEATQKAEQDRIERERADATQKAEQDRIERERADATQKAELDRIERERAEATQKAELDRIERERAEATQKAELDRIERERAEATQKAELDRIDWKRAEATQKAEQDRNARDAGAVRQKEEANQESDDKTNAMPQGISTSQSQGVSGPSGLAPSIAPVRHLLLKGLTLLILAILGLVVWINLPNVGIRKDAKTESSSSVSNVSNTSKQGRIDSSQEIAVSEIQFSKFL